MGQESGDQLFSDRLRRAVDAARAKDLDALLVTPGADLRYLVGYDALPLERLTCLVVPARGEPVLIVPRLERPAAEASGASALVKTVSTEETEDAFSTAAALVRDALGGEPTRIAVSDRMWAEQVLRFGAAMPAAEQVLAGSVLRALRLCKAPDEVAGLRRAGAAIDAVHSRMAEWLRPGRTEEEVGRDIAEAIVDVGPPPLHFAFLAG